MATHSYSPILLWPHIAIDTLLTGAVKLNYTTDSNGEEGEENTLLSLSQTFTIPALPT